LQSGTIFTKTLHYVSLLFKGGGEQSETEDCPASFSDQAITRHGADAVPPSL